MLHLGIQHVIIISELYIFSVTILDASLAYKTLQNEGFQDRCLNYGVLHLYCFFGGLGEPPTHQGPTFILLHWRIKGTSDTSEPYIYIASLEG